MRISDWSSDVALPISGRTPYTLWRDDHDGFLLYQSIQSVQNGPKLTGRYWASFVVTPAASTLFVGLYEIEKIGPCDPTIIDPLRGVPVTQGGARELDLYRQAVVGVSMEDAGRVYIDWGPGTRAWVQRAQEKPRSEEHTSELQSRIRNSYHGLGM